MNTVIILAGGVGIRMGNNVPKQFLLLAQKPILIHTIEKFIAFDAQLDIIIALPENQIELWKDICQTYKFEHPHTIVGGGITRFHSVRNALEKVKQNCDIVAIHDGVRPLVSQETIKNCFETAKNNGCAIPILEITESIRHIESNSSKIINRDGICTIQTPQVFNYKAIYNAYRQAYSTEFTDDASVFERQQGALFFVKGNRENVKITLPEDILFAEKLI